MKRKWILPAKPLQEAVFPSYKTKSETTYQQHFFVLYLPFCLMSLWALFLSSAVHTSGSHLLLPYFHPPLYITLCFLPAAPTQLPTSNFLAFSSSRLFLIPTNHCRLLSLSLPLPLCLSYSLCAALQQAIFVLFTHCGKTTHYGELGGGWPYGESSASLIKVTLSAMREGWYGQRGGGGGSRGRKMGGGVQLWVNCMRAPISIRSQLLSNGKKHQCLHLLLTNSHDWAL